MISRHNRLRNAIFKHAESALLSPLMEIRGLVEGSEAHPADVFIPNWIGEKDAALDITVVSPVQAACLERSVDNPSFSLEFAYRRKMRSAAAACRQVNVAFIPLAVQTFGSWHDEAATHLRRLAKALARRSGSPESTAIKHFFEKLAVLLQRGNAHFILGRQSVVPSALDGDV